MAPPTIAPGKTRIGWIGTGVMGSSMCGHLIERGFAATVFNRTKDKAQPLLDRGAKWADTPRAVAEASDVVFAIVGFPADVRSVFLGEQGALHGVKAGSVLVDMTTSEPSLAVEIYEAAKRKGVHSVDAPVSGGDVGAKEARLSIMIGGDREISDALMPCWQTLGKTIVYQGTAGAGVLLGGREPSDAHRSTSCRRMSQLLPNHRGYPFSPVARSLSDAQRAGHQRPVVGASPLEPEQRHRTHDNQTGRR
jgi:3-hydroxyisobutyrate dehydrogenase